MAVIDLGRRDPSSYPSVLVQEIKWQGRTITVRPIRPDDAAQHLAFLGEVHAADIRMRVFHTRNSISPRELQRLTHIDYQREMAFVAVEIDGSGTENTLGVARAVTIGSDQAEFGIVIRSDLKGQGLGELLMRCLIEQQRGRGTHQLVATVLAENTRMLELAQRLGFVTRPCDEGEGVRCVVLQL